MMVQKKAVKKKKAKKKKRIPVLTITLWILTIFSIFLAFKTSSEPILRIFKNTSIETLFRQFTIGNSLVFSVSMGFLVSMIFYLLVVWIPDRRRKNLIKHNFEEQYKMFKRDMIWAFLSILRITRYDPDLLSKLSDVKEFRNYFKEPFCDSQCRWDGVLNGLNEYHLKDILVTLEIFRNEVAYVLNNVEINVPEAFAFFKRLSQAVYSLKNSSFKDDEIKEFSHFVWQLFGGFSFAEGCKDHDIVKIMIKKI